MLVVFPPILVADTKIIYGYNSVAPFKMDLEIRQTYSNGTYLQKQLQNTELS